MKVQITVRHFGISCVNLFITEEISFNRGDESYWIICDDATIHKSKLIVEFLISNNIWIITIPPYCPSLNAIERLILSIKQKINKEIDSGKEDYSTNYNYLIKFFL